MFRRRSTIAAVLLKIVVAVCIDSGAFAQAVDPPAATVDYLRDVQPILEANCYDCHAQEEQSSGLRLDTRTAILRGGNRGATVVSEKPLESELLRALLGEGDTPRMPPEDYGEPLDETEINTLRQWIVEGATGPDDAAIAQSMRRTSDHWSFLPVVRPMVPNVKQRAWVRNSIDAFVLTRLEADDIRPSPEAARTTLIRRLSFDLRGLPPTPEEVDRFCSDPSSDAYDRLVDRMLDSPHYGERWGRYWLDAARYADSDGYTIDAPREIWKYRDWVIDALNNDMPFDAFTMHQMAGDLLSDVPLAATIATGFHRNTLINQEGGTDKEQFRVEAVVDRVTTVGTVYLGLTLNCARCHDHKFDPISQREFYELFAFLNNDDEPKIDVPTPLQTERRRQLQPPIDEVTREIKQRDEQLAAEQPAWEAKLSTELRSKLPADVQAALELMPEQRDEKQQQALAKSHRESDPQRKELAAKLNGLKKQLPKVPTTMVLRARDKPRTTHVHIRGDFLRHGAEVTARVPEVLPAIKRNGDQTLTRLDLARWLVDPRNPLPARVTVNRVWQAYFGRGLVETENDFGTQGSPPSHPRLLDWLASEFVENGWSLKSLHRLIVRSASYRQSSHARPDLDAIDPDNRLLARQSRRRFAAEVIRDNALAVSGLLSRKVGGPSVFPYQPDGVMRLAQVERPWNVSPGEDGYRRGMYTYFWRSTPHPFLKTFDAPDSNTTCTRRYQSNTPLQALTLLNDQSFIECAEALGKHLAECDIEDDAARVRYAVQLCLAREPNEYEMTRLLDLIAIERETEDQHHPWTTLARVMLNLDEFITRE